jgi:branched-chain amino acid transport system ATP-binding protein
MILQISGLTAGYDDGPDIIHSVDFELHEGEIVTIIGPNGAGKSTVLKAVFGLIDVRSGEVLHGSRDITKLPTHERIRSGIAFVTQGNNVFPDLTVRENLEMGAFTLPNRREVRAKLEEVYHFFPKLKHFAKRNAGLLSGGERQMVAIGMALMLSPEVLLLDEPSIGLAPKIIDEVFARIETIRQDGTCVLMVEQNATKALKVSDRAYVLELGKNSLTGSGSDLLADPHVGELYLGKSQALAKNT